MLTLQRIFDKVTNHMRKQGERCVVQDDNGSKCQYRAEKKVKGRIKVQFCAAGCLIPKRDYSPAFEGYSVSPHNHNEKISKYFHKRFNGNIKKLELIQALQNVHDSEYQFEDKENQFARIASKHGLKYTQPAAI